MGATAMKLEGGCLCGAIRYEFTGDIARAGYCHCLDCRKSGGSLFHFAVMVPRDGLTIHGDPASFEKPSDAGRKIRRRFCAKCGSGVWNELEHRETQVVLKAGTLDHIPDALKPEYEVYASRKSAWIETPTVTSSFSESSTTASGQKRL